MAENPATWTPLERIIHDQMNLIAQQRAEDDAAGEFRCGFSTPRLIADAIREKYELIEKGTA